MLEVNGQIRIPDDELHWSFVRASGPGGQNVNKVASKAVLHWNLVDSAVLPNEVKQRLRASVHRRMNAEGVLILSSQRFRDQKRNIDDCRDKLRAMIMQALRPPRLRKPTKPTRGSQAARLQAKKHRALVKVGRRRPIED